MTEAELCIKDCVESIETDQFSDDELKDATLAVDAAGVAYSDLLEELAVTDEGVEMLNGVRKAMQPILESLRLELKVVSETNGSEATDSED